jgi:hypothetical protein
MDLKPVPFRSPLSADMPRSFAFCSTPAKIPTAITPTATTPTRLRCTKPCSAATRPWCGFWSSVARGSISATPSGTAHRSDGRCTAAAMRETRWLGSCARSAQPSSTKDYSSGRRLGSALRFAPVRRLAAVRRLVTWRLVPRRFVVWRFVVRRPVVRRLVNRRHWFVRRPPVVPAGPASPTVAGALRVAAPVPARALPTLVVPAITAAAPNVRPVHDGIEAVGRGADRVRRQGRAGGDAAGNQP